MATPPRRTFSLQIAVFSVIALAIAGLAATVGAAPQEKATADAAANGEFVPGNVIVGYTASATASDKGRARVAAGASGSRRIAESVELLTLSASTDVRATIARLERQAGVRYAEPNYILRPAVTSNDPYYTGGSLWGMYGDATTRVNQYGSQAGEAWEAGYTGSPDVYVGVIDEGIQAGHPDLSGNVWTNPFDPLNGVDDDGNGYIDDVSGWDFDAKNNSTYDGTADDHGTHVAGTIGGRGGNGIGVAGVNWNVTMIPAKFLGARGGTTANAVLALDYLTDLKTRHKINIVATSNSWGGGGFSQALLDAINRSGDAGMLFVAAAGNGGSDGVGDNNDVVANYPSNYECTTKADGSPRGYDCVVAVAAITTSGARSTFSNYGAKMVDLGAPGSGINSTVPVGSYASYSGTSMATPHVSGAIALCAAVKPTLTAADLRNLLLQSAAPTPALATVTASGGRLDVSAYTTRCNSGSTTTTTSDTPPAPIAPAAFGKTAPANGASGLSSSVKLSWQAATGATSYAVCVDTSNDGQCAGSWTNVGTALAATFKGSSRRTYYWNVQALNGSTATDANGGTWWTFSTR